MTYWLTYLRLENQRGAKISRPESFAALVFAATFSSLWLYFGSPNSFGKDGLTHGLGSLTSLLAGFYVAGLVAIATFFRENSSLDDVIEKGPVINPNNDGGEKLTRRQYVCAIFGFLVGLSFFLAITSVVMGVLSKAISERLADASFVIWTQNIDIHSVTEWTVLTVWLAIFADLVIVTFRGLYYLMDRIYDVRPKIGPRSRRGNPDP